MAVQRVKVLYILGSSHSGSSLLASLLGEVQGFFAAAEMRLVWHGIDGRRCGCGRVVRECLIWAPAIAAATRSGLRDEREVLRAQSSTVRLRNLSTLLLRREVPTPQAAAYGRMLGAMYMALAEATGARVIVDSSKSAAEATLLRDSADVEASLVHLVRDPRAMSYSLRRRAAQAGPRQRLRTTTELALRWSVTNAVAELVSGTYRGRSALVRYEDLLARPGQTLSRLAELVGEDASDLGFLHDPSWPRASRHMVGGNALRFDQNVVRLRPDAAWMDGLKPASAPFVTGLTLPLLLRYGYLHSPARPAIPSS
jgi:hypothetical protein